VDSRYQPGQAVIVTPRQGNPFPATVIRDAGIALVEVQTSTGRLFPARAQVAPAGDFLSRGEQPTPANAVYRGVMAERLEKRR
jgi:hypothetical protein